ncbi:HIT domain-containing protein [Micromonospora sp. NPDC005194]|uniref:HIT family protein n=1 Tax=Micromonospora sp. NPDC005194 TaxID=3156870 RepID=UPI0033A2A6A1
MTSHIQVPPAERCAFCDYLSGKRPYSILERSELAATLVTREQRGASHLLVVPVRHCPTLLELKKEESHAIMDLVRRAARAIDLTEQRPGIAVWQNNGVPAHQTIPHVHFHVAGTLPEGGTEWGDVEELPIYQTEGIAANLRAALAGCEADAAGNHEHTPSKG